MVIYGEESVVCHNCTSSVCVIQDMIASSFLFFSHLKFDLKIIFSFKIKISVTDKIRDVIIIIFKLD